MNPERLNEEVGVLQPTLTIDQQANAAFLKFTDGKVARTVPVNDDGRVVATLSFLESGELHGIEVAGRTTPNPERCGV